jgi:hypothetical protein
MGMSAIPLKLNSVDGVGLIFFLAGAFAFAFRLVGGLALCCGSSDCCWDARDGIGEESIVDILLIRVVFFFGTGADVDTEPLRLNENPSSSSTSL